MMDLFLRPINTTTLFTVIGLVVGIAAIFAILIVLVSKLCYVKENEKVKKIQENLSGANCGGCGFAGCADFAKALVEGKAKINGCSATDNDSKKIIAQILEVEFCSNVEKFAVVKCAGGDNAVNKFDYVGNSACEYQSAFLGGSKVCAEGCLGGGTCTNYCAGGGIKVKNGVAVIDRNLCKACGACILKCPRHIIELIPKTSKVYVACSTSCKGKEAVSACKNSCIACGLCTKVCPENAISLVNNIAVVDYSKCNGCLTCLSKCPRKCIKMI